MSKILVIGESCTDVFVYCEAKRLAPDLPVPVLEVKLKVQNPGMAMNVQRNILRFEDNCELNTNPDWETITKTRYVHEKTNHTFIRIDSPHNIQPLLMSQLSLNYDVVIISDYNKGFLSEDLISFIGENHGLVFLDTKKKLGEWASSCKFIKINNYEYERSKGFINKELRRKIIHTDGENGCTYNEKMYPVNKVEVKDSTGAGDAFLAALVANYVKSENIEDSISFANEYASKVVQHRGVSVI